MSTHMIGVLSRAVLYSLLSGVVAAIIYMIIRNYSGGLESR
jgi:hypothetical protein